MGARFPELDSSLLQTLGYMPNLFGSFMCSGRGSGRLPVGRPSVYNLEVTSVLDRSARCSTLIGGQWRISVSSHRVCHAERRDKRISRVHRTARSKQMKRKV